MQPRPHQNRLTFPIAAAFVAAVWAGWVFLQPPLAETRVRARLRPSEPVTMSEAMSELADEAKSHIQGAIGVAVTQDSSTGWLRVMNVLSNSPAVAAGLQQGDLISEINGKPLAGVPMADAVTLMRGIKLTTVDLTIRHASATNFEHTLIKRVSFKKVMQLSTGGR